MTDLEWYESLPKAWRFYRKKGAKWPHIAVAVLTRDGDEWLAGVSVMHVGSYDSGPFARIEEADAFVEDVLAWHGEYEPVKDTRPGSGVTHDPA